MATQEKAVEKAINIPLTPELRSDLETVSDHNGRTMRRQALRYIAGGVAKDLRRMRRVRDN